MVSFYIRLTRVRKLILTVHGKVVNQDSFLISGIVHTEKPIKTIAVIRITVDAVAMVCSSPIVEDFALVLNFSFVTDDVPCRGRYNFEDVTLLGVQMNDKDTQLSTVTKLVFTLNPYLIYTVGCNSILVAVLMVVAERKVCMRELTQVGSIPSNDTTVVCGVNDTTLYDQDFSTNGFIVWILV